ncbi:MAG: signal peptidase I [Dehalococcoidia bacterium]|nr:MAG: signal peptidase I [Dehalococcoidia bacterium]
MKTFFREIVITAILALAVFFFLRVTVDTVIVIGISMEPSFHNEQRLLINKIAYRLHEPERGDVIVFQPANNQEGDYIKRIIALPNDTVEIKKEAVYINGEKLNEPYIKSPPSYTIKEQKIPENSYFVLGDNRNKSNDSHNGWVVPRQNIVGKVWLSIWPPAEWELVPDYSLTEQPAGAISNYLTGYPIIYINR